MALLSVICLRRPHLALHGYITFGRGAVHAIKTVCRRTTGFATQTRRPLSCVVNSLRSHPTEYCRFRFKTCLERWYRPCLHCRCRPILHIYFCHGCSAFWQTDSSWAKINELGYEVLLQTALKLCCSIAEISGATVLPRSFVRAAWRQAGRDVPAGDVTVNDFVQAFMPITTERLRVKTGKGDWFDNFKWISSHTAKRDEHTAAFVVILSGCVDAVSKRSPDAWRLAFVKRLIPRV